MGFRLPLGGCLRSTKAPLPAAALFLGLAWSTVAQAAANPVTAPAGRGQQALAVSVVSGGLRLHLCARAPCDAASGTPHSLPAEVAPLLDAASLTVLPLGEGRHVVHLVVPDPAQRRAYEMLLAAPLAGQTPLVVFEGFTGLVTGQEGEREGPMVFVSDATDGGDRRVVVGKQYESITLCGRPTVLAPNILNPADLKLYPAKVQRLTPTERNHAQRLKAERLGPETRLGPPVLTALGASSAVGAPQSLTDGDLTTTWAENRGAEGRGEFVTFSAPPQLPISGFDFVVRPPIETPPAAGAAASEFWLALPDRVINVALPDDAWQAPGAAYRVKFDAPIQTDCVALVIESTRAKGRDVQVTFSEITAVSEFDSRDLPGLVGALAGGGERAEAAKTVLMSGGPIAFRAVADAFSKLDEGGRRVALEVIDRADCELATPTYVRALLGRYEAQAIHARDRIRRCGRKSADHLVSTLRVALPRARPILAEELGLVAPDRAITEIAPLLNDEVSARRSLLRVALARAAADSTAERAVNGVLLDAGLSEMASLDVLRALGGSLAEHGAAAGQAFDRLAKAKDFRTRFLLLGPAAALAGTHAAARNYLSRVLTSDPDAHMRFGAALAAAGAHELTNELLSALDDDAVRVRRAVVEAIGRKHEVRAQAPLIERLERDRWPMVRSAAADALAGMGPSPAVDSALNNALDDASPAVRAPVVLALGQRKVQSSAPAIRELLADTKEHPSVRRAAARASGRLCDHAALDTLTELAVKRADPLLDPDQKSLSVEALQALAALGPADLGQRLSPLRVKGAAPGAREAAEATAAVAPSCPRR